MAVVPAAGIFPVTEKFEYRREMPPRYGRTVEEDPEDDMLKRMGLEGWELCGVVKVNDGWNSIFYFKRPLPQPWGAPSVVNLV